MSAVPIAAPKGMIDQPRRLDGKSAARLSTKR
jgi:hypothetical protein